MHPLSMNSYTFLVGSRWKYMIHKAQVSPYLKLSLKLQSKFGMTFSNVNLFNGYNSMKKIVRGPIEFSQLASIEIDLSSIKLKSNKLYHWLLSQTHINLLIYHQSN